MDINLNRAFVQFTTNYLLRTNIQHTWISTSTEFRTIYYELIFKIHGYQLRQNFVLFTTSCLLRTNYQHTWISTSTASRLKFKYQGRPTANVTAPFIAAADMKKWIYQHLYILYASHFTLVVLRSPIRRLSSDRERSDQRSPIQRLSSERERSDQRSPTEGNMNVCPDQVLHAKPELSQPSLQTWRRISRVLHSF